MVFRNVVAVDDLTLEAPAGAVLGLVGPNGSGKTTTLRMLSGILPTGPGSVEIAGFDLDRQAIEAKRRLAYVPDDPKLFEGLTVWEHVRFTASMYQVDDYERKANELLQRFHLAEKRNFVCSELSRGMRHKLGLCCALLHEPHLLLLDEPLAGLDPQAIRELKEHIRRQAQAGGGVIISSHLLHLIEDLCTHLLVLRCGTCRYRGTLAGFRAQAGDGGSLEDHFLAVTADSKPESNDRP